MYKIYIHKNISSQELLKRILKKYNIPYDIYYNEYGKPYVKGNAIYFNLSHSKEYTVCAISDREIGVDIQEVVFKKRLISKICTEEEIKKIHSPNDFTKLWVKKESYVKCIGQGLSYGLKNVDTLSLTNIHVKKKGNYYIAVCLK